MLRPGRSPWPSFFVKNQPFIAKKSILTWPSYSTKRDPYEILDVDKKASASAIKRAYFELAKKYHPDTNKDPKAKDKFVEIQDAYDLLSDEGKKASYDQYGYNENSSAHYDDGASFHGRSGPIDPADIFKAFFGSSRGSNSGFDPFGGSMFSGSFGRRSGGDSPISLDIITKISLTFMEAVQGTIRTINVSRLTQCDTCSGSGVSPGKRLSKCKGCDGKGSKIFSRGGMIIEVPCDTCSGEGTLNMDPCKACSGKGATKKPSVVEVKVPSGVDEASQLVMKGAGHSIHSRTGNLCIQFKVFRQGCMLKSHRRHFLIF